MIRHQGPLTLSEDLWGVNGAGADLDAPATDAQWGVLNLTPDAQEDIKWWGLLRIEVPQREGITFEDPAKGTMVRGGTDCRLATGYTNSVILFKALKPGSILCVNTSEGRFSALEVLSATKTDPFTIKFDVTTFAKPDGD